LVGLSQGGSPFEAHATALTPELAVQVAALIQGPQAEQCDAAPTTPPTWV